MDPSEWNGIAKLEELSEGEEDLDLDTLVRYYQLHHKEKPLSRLLEDMHTQSLIWLNIIERIKAGEEPAHINHLFQDELQLVPEGVSLPNPNGRALFDRAAKKLSKYRDAMVTFVRKWGGKFLDELSMATDLTVGLGVELGFPPAVVLTVEHTYSVVEEGRWGSSTGQSRTS